jgi:hypothetical protein
MRSGSGLESREYGRRDPLCSPRNSLYPKKFELTSPTSGGRSVGIVRLRTFFFITVRFILRIRVNHECGCVLIVTRLLLLLCEAKAGCFCCSAMA